LFQVIRTQITGTPLVRANFDRAYERSALLVADRHAIFGKNTFRMTEVVLHIDDDQS
jgi:hypothetical protein